MKFQIFKHDLEHAATYRDDQSQMWSLQEIHEKFLKIKFLVLYSREKVNDFRDLEVTDFQQLICYWVQAHRRDEGQLTEKMAD